MLFLFPSFLKILSSTLLKHLSIVVPMHTAALCLVFIPHITSNDPLQKPVTLTSLSTQAATAPQKSLSWSYFSFIIFLPFTNNTYLCTEDNSIVSIIRQTVIMHFHPAIILRASYQHSSKPREDRWVLLLLLPGKSLWCFVSLEGFTSGTER